MTVDVPAAVAEAAIRDFVEPTVHEIEAQLKERLPTRVVYGSPPNEVMLGAGEPRGEIRLACKALFKPGSFKVFAEAVYRGVAPGTGFSGFRLACNVRVEADGVRTSENYSCTMRYNQWEFTGWG